MTDIRPHAGNGQDTEADLQQHLAELEAQAVLDADPPVARSASAAELAELQRLRDELRLLKSRMTLIKEQARMAGRAHVNWLDASAHQQLGDRPWLKLAGAMAGTFVVARLLKSVSILPVVLPLLLQRSIARR